MSAGDLRAPMILHAFGALELSYQMIISSLNVLYLCYISVWPMSMPPQIHILNMLSSLNHWFPSLLIIIKFGYNVRCHRLKEFALSKCKQRDEVQLQRHLPIPFFYFQPLPSNLVKPTYFKPSQCKRDIRAIELKK